VQSPITMLFATVAFCGSLGATGVAYAADDATNNQCWGENTSEFQAEGQPGLGEHASNPPGIEPGDGRRGVGNVSKDFDDDPEDGDNPLSEGAQGDHAIAVGGPCDGPPVP
jgi:hypothetical protein